MGNDITSVDQWSSNTRYSTTRMFQGAKNLIIRAQYTPNLFNVLSMSRMFLGAISVGNTFDTGNWDWKTLNVKYLDYMFTEATLFNKNIGYWDTSSVENMESMFYLAPSFNQNIGSWDTHRVTDMTYMFSYASLFDQPIGNWDTSNVLDMNSMFRSAKSFNQDISNWNTSRVKNLTSMFSFATSFDQNLGNWNIESVDYFSFANMFRGIRLSIPNYDALLVDWNGQNINTNVGLVAGESIYCSAAAQEAHENLVTNYSWNIVDGGVCENSLTILTKSIVFDENKIQLSTIEYSDPDFDTANFVLSGGDDMAFFSLDSCQVRYLLSIHLILKTL